MTARKGRGVSDSAIENNEPLRAIPTGFPHKLSDDALEDTIERMLTQAANQPPFATLLAELQLAIVTVGLQERARRAADKAERWALWVAVAAFIVSLASIVVAFAT